MPCLSQHTARRSILTCHFHNAKASVHAGLVNNAPDLELCNEHCGPAKIKASFTSLSIS